MKVIQFDSFLFLSDVLSEYAYQALNIVARSSDTHYGDILHMRYHDINNIRYPTHAGSTVGIYHISSVIRQIIFLPKQS